jgi:hypothetical protein
MHRLPRLEEKEEEEEVVVVVEEAAVAVVVAAAADKKAEVEAAVCGAGMNASHVMNASLYITGFLHGTCISCDECTSCDECISCDSCRWMHLLFLILNNTSFSLSLMLSLAPLVMNASLVLGALDPQLLRSS